MIPLPRCHARAAILSFLVLPWIRAMEPYPHLYHPCVSTSCPAACVVNSATDTSPVCVTPGPIDQNPIGVSFNLAAIPEPVLGITMTNDTINATHFFGIPTRRGNLEFLNVSGVPNLNTIIIRFVNMAHTNVEKWIVPPTVATLLLFNCSLVNFPNLTDTDWPSLTYLDMSNNTDQLRTKLEVDQGGEIALRFPFLQQLGGIGLSALGLRSIPKFIFKLPKLTRLFVRHNNFTLISLSLAEYQFLTKPGMDLHIHTFPKTPGRDYGDWSGESLPNCPESPVISIVYNSSNGENWSVCVDDPDSATQIAAIVLAWTVLSGMAVAVVYLVVMKVVRRHRHRHRGLFDSDAATSSVTVAPPSLFHWTTFRDLVTPAKPATTTTTSATTIISSSAYPAIESDVTNDTVSTELDGWLLRQQCLLRPHMLEWTEVEYKVRLYHSKQDGIWTDSTSATDVMEVWKGSYRAQLVLVKRVSGMYCTLGSI
ncbi:TKL protein kinase, variant [Aphanomyces astaci]|uniref:TKL protein kinase, variant n=1 Tax=Aphanomyces astaci TaxID=112090 RepID=W4H3H7_APHAT|nr:TKL protein kinase, variant [Aphanomyces astaci]ETV85703.1 TKL protein kinase, variant [Aphanomyces astaci]|eukprot:XP_009824175.1 TKL protein kinase, variant [Aphanomyces astaci]